MNPIETRIFKNCSHCEKPLKNFTKTKDFKYRSYHLKCFKIVEEKRKLNEFIDNMNNKCDTNVKHVI